MDFERSRPADSRRSAVPPAATGSKITGLPSRLACFPASIMASVSSIAPMLHTRASAPVTASAASTDVVGHGRGSSGGQQDVGTVVHSDKIGDALYQRGPLPDPRAPLQTFHYILLLLVQCLLLVRFLLLVQFLQDPAEYSGTAQNQKYCDAHGRTHDGRWGIKRYVIIR